MTHRVMGKVHMQLIGTATGDTSPGLLLFFENKRYLFNFGEGMQRFCMEHKVRLSRVNDIFVTRITSSSVGGLPGLQKCYIVLLSDGRTAVDPVRNRETPSFTPWPLQLVTLLICNTLLLLPVRMD